ncbi:MAG: sigma 54-interacting transcriptional regulator [Desulfarculaceae bacterium]|nr:sigma 54-interacting transcriptional regulator [Desulfarculaceae bacterium]MCF8048146.1 sigma 54-interacting transcriptional regulator [Desulfarculaceae bacterium]MCF8098687.1 sigma 54-interacting transcriptional regulator [Desulfarculaceae bacterium]MCF8121807.1 sigma 54-interacting transcriptional regulator [Desulfarculaceae bacterium]
MADITPQDVARYWHSVVDTMAEGLFIVDTKGKVVFVNPAAERLTGYRQEEVLGRSCTVFESETCLACQDQEGQMACGLFDKGRVVDRRCTITTKDGSQVHMLKNARVLHDELGQVIGGVETLSDITPLVERDRKISGLKRHLTRSYGYEGLIGQSPAMMQVYQLLEAAAASTAPVVILGASGTGKELAAAAIHRRSPRAEGPFIKVNCAALNPSLLESELFGHEKGAFTGAEKSRTGRFEAADGGSLFLDEIGDLPAEVQVKLLRVLQEGEVERVGSNRSIKVDVRIITATNRDLAQLMERGQFREDLFYRINVIPIYLPPLAKRKEDIPLLTRTFVERTALGSDRGVTGISPAALDRLLEHPWPGNVRELINAIEYAFVTCPGGEILPQHLPPSIVGEHYACLPLSDAPGGEAGGEAVRREIAEALEATGGHKAQAAARLGISRVTLWKRMKKLGMALEG